MFCCDLNIKTHTPRQKYRLDKKTSTCLNVYYFYAISASLFSSMFLKTFFFFFYRNIEFEIPNVLSGQVRHLMMIIVKHVFFPQLLTIKKKVYSTRL